MMTNIFSVFLFVFTFFTHSSVQASPFDALDSYCIIKISSFCDPKAALTLTKANHRFQDLKPFIKAAQLPKLYAAIDRDMSQAFMLFDQGRFAPIKTIPKPLIPLVHEWYLAGRKSKDTMTKFCHLFAAGRAGHYYAAKEAGEMLLQSTDPINKDTWIPCTITLEDLNKYVPEFGCIDHQEWDIAGLNQDVITNTEVKTAYESINSIYDALFLNFY